MYTVEQETTLTVAGIQKMTTIDFPGHLAAVFFLSGCPWHCRYCHNPLFRDASCSASVPMEECEHFLSLRKDFLEGIVVSGGEPTACAELPSLLRWIRSFGYKTALHTNGFFPEVLQKIVQDRLVDYIGMDIKGPPRKYDQITGFENSCLPVARSIDIITSSGIDFEFRTTYHPAILSESELTETMHAVARRSPNRYYIQLFRKEGVCDQELAEGGDVVTIPTSLLMMGKKLFKDFGVR
jgi:pyruvate formate lyase activating enzyme